MHIIDSTVKLNKTKKVLLILNMLKRMKEDKLTFFYAVK